MSIIHRKIISTIIRFSINRRFLNTFKFSNPFHAMIVLLNFELFVYSTVPTVDNCAAFIAHVPVHAYGNQRLELC